MKVFVLSIIYLIMNSWSWYPMWKLLNLRINLWSIHFNYPCWVLPLRDSKDIHRSAKYEDQFVIADWRLLKVLTSDSNLLKTLKLFKSLNVNVHFLNTKKEDYILEISCEFYSSSFSIYRNPKISFKSSLNLNVYLGHPV